MSREGVDKQLCLLQVRGGSRLRRSSRCPADVDGHAWVGYRCCGTSRSVGQERLRVRRCREGLRQHLEVGLSRTSSRPTGVMEEEQPTDTAR